MIPETAPQMQVGDLVMAIISSRIGIVLRADANGTTLLLLSKANFKDPTAMAGVCSVVTHMLKLLQRRST